MTSPIGGDQYKSNQTTTNTRPDARTVNDFHTNSDVDSSGLSQHHTLGTSKNTAAEGSHSHDGKTSQQIPLSSIVKNPLTVTGAKAGNAALASLITQLQAMGLIVDSTT